MTKLKLPEETEVLGRMAALDARAGPGEWSSVHGGQVVRDMVFTPAGLLISEQWAAMQAQPTSRAWWASVIPPSAETSGDAPGEYL